MENNNLDEYICGICLDLLIKPLILKCKHYFCKSCIDGMKDYNISIYCPICKCEI